MKRILCLFLCCILIFCLTGCDLRGDTSVLSTYNSESLIRTYDAILAGDMEVEMPLNETFPEIEAFLVDSKDYFSNVVTFYLFNQSSFFIQIKGYAWLVKPIGNEFHGYKMIYYNSEKQVSNASYKIRIDPGNNTYLPFEALDKRIGEPDLKAMMFFFFSYEDSEYVGCVNAYRDKPFVCWPLSQTKLVKKSDTVQLQTEISSEAPKTTKP